jgi:hypothetical protein
MAKVEITWTETVVETFHAVVEYDEFKEVADAEGYSMDELNELLGESYGDWDSYIASLNGCDPDTSSVENRDVDSIKVIED